MSESMSCWICATIESALDDMAVLLLHNRWVVLPIIAQSRRSFNATMFTCRFRIRPHGLWSHSFDLAYWLHPSSEGHGYLSEAVRLITQVAFDTLGAQRVAIVCDQKNARSRHVPERLGYVLEGCLRNNARGADGTLFDMLIFALTPADYQRVLPQWPD